MAPKKSSPWVDGPFKLITSAISGEKKGHTEKGARRMAAEMTVVHNCLIRGINAVYQQCDNVTAQGSAQDKADFVNFAAQWAAWIEEHHEVEERDFFPEMAEMTGVPGLMDANVNEHKVFHKGLEEMLAYLGKVKKGEDVFEGARLKNIIDGFMPVLRDHLEHEIDTLVELEKFNEKIRWDPWFKKKTDTVVKNGMADSAFRTDVFPLMIIFHDKTFEDGVWQNFPPMPWIMHVVLRWLFMNKRSNWWRFSGCDFYSMPKRLPFA